MQLRPFVELVAAFCRGKAIHVLIAPSGYKESLSAEEVASAIATGARRASPRLQCHELPLADGGEGTAQTLANLTGGDIRKVRVTGPVGDPVDSHFAMLGGKGPPTAVVELAAASGLKLVPRDRRDPSRTTSRGVGELIAAALNAGARRILVGCGDSGVNDGGAGLVQALGARLLDRHGKDIEPGGIGLGSLHAIDLSSLDPRLRDAKIDVGCNIRNVLTGEHGVARLFGPQKGASPEDVERLAAALDNYAAVIEHCLGIDVREMPGGGASGGVGAGLHALCGATLRSRFDAFLPLFDLDRHIARADVVITAEGGLDYKTARGKLPAEIAERGRAAGLPVIVLAGTIGDQAEVVLEHGVCAYFSTVNCPETLDEAMSRASEEVALVAEHVMRTLLAGVEMGRMPRA
jgi:glycerate 2-kinase